MSFIFSLIADVMRFIGWLSAKRDIAQGVQQEQDREIRAEDQAIRRADAIRDQVRHESADRAVDRL